MMPQRAGVPHPGLRLPGAPGFAKSLAWKVQVQIIRCWVCAATSVNLHKHQFLLVFAHLMGIDRGTVQSDLPSKPVCCTPSSSVPAALFCATPIAEKPFLTSYFLLDLESLPLLGSFLLGYQGPGLTRNSYYVNKTRPVHTGDLHCFSCPINWSLTSI